MNLEKRLPNITKTTLVACSASIVLLLTSITYTGHIMYIYLAWNLFLAWIPLYIACFLEYTKTKWKVLALISAWLLFFPNAPYIITDMIHLGQNSRVPLWVDIILLFSFGWSGLVLGLASLLKIHATIQRYLKPVSAWLTMCFFMGLSGFGIYLGRVERYNSWDIITNPFSLFKDVAHILLHPFQYPASIGFTIAFFIFLLTAYSTVYLLYSKQKAHV